MTEKGDVQLRSSSITLRQWLVVFGWMLVIGGLLELFDLLYHAWPRYWYARTVLHGLIGGPVAHIGLGIGLWALARR